jgi:hypothetical protein
MGRRVRTLDGSCRFIQEKQAGAWKRHGRTAILRIEVTLYTICTLHRARDRHGNSGVSRWRYCYDAVGSPRSYVTRSYHPDLVDTGIRLATEGDINDRKGDRADRSALCVRWSR